MQNQLDLDKAWDRAPLLLTLGVTYAVLLATSFAMLPDPFIRHDDYPALLADPNGYYIKTLDEGRWISYLWHLRGFVLPSWLSFAVYQLLWATFAAAATFVLCGPKVRARVALPVSLFIMVAPPATLISLWFNTLLPGLAIVVLFTLLVVRFGAQRMRIWLLVFVPVTLMCYTSYPLLLLAVLITAHDTRWSARNLVALLALFVVSFALGLLTIYSLNWVYHGVFGIPMAEWRQPNPVTDMASLQANLATAGEFLARMMDTFAQRFAPLAWVILAFVFFGLVLLARREGWPAAYIVAGLAAGFGLVLLQILRSGVIMSPRVMIFAWVMLAAIVARMLMFLETRQMDLGIRVLRGGALIIVGSYALNSAHSYMSYMPWQVESRAMADALPAGDGPIWVTGDSMLIPTAGDVFLQNPRGFSMRLAYLTGRVVHDCSEGADSDPGCAELQNAPEEKTELHLGHILSFEGGTVLQLPKEPLSLDIVLHDPAGTDF